MVARIVDWRVTVTLGVAAVLASVMTGCRTDKAWVEEALSGFESASPVSPVLKGKWNADVPTPGGLGVNVRAQSSVNGRVTVAYPDEASPRTACKSHDFLYIRDIRQSPDYSRLFTLMSAESLGNWPEMWVHIFDLTTREPLKPVRRPRPAGTTLPAFAQ